MSEQQKTYEEAHRVVKQETRGVGIRTELMPYIFFAVAVVLIWLFREHCNVEASDYCELDDTMLASALAMSLYIIYTAIHDLRKQFRESGRGVS